MDFGVEVICNCYLQVLHWHLLICHLTILSRTHLPRWNEVRTDEYFIPTQQHVLHTTHCKTLCCGSCVWVAGEWGHRASWVASTRLDREKRVRWTQDTCRMVKQVRLMRACAQTHTDKKIIRYPVISSGHHKVSSLCLQVSPPVRTLTAAFLRQMAPNFMRYGYVYRHCSLVHGSFLKSWVVRIKNHLCGQILCLAE